MSGRLPFLDANCLLGPWGSGPARAFAGLPALRTALDRYGLSGALCAHAAALHYDPATGNAALFQELNGQTDVHACAVFPFAPGLAGADAGTQATAWRRAGARAVRVLPKRSGPLRDFLYRPTFAALASQGCPVLLDFELGHWSTHMRELDWDGLRWALAEFPALPFVLLRVGLAVDRPLFALLERHANLYLEISSYAGTGGLERLCERFGPRRCLFGTGMPLYDPGPALTLVAYSGLSVEAKRRVAGENLSELLDGGAAPSRAST